jgi:hypothetical protein
MKLTPWYDGCQKPVRPGPFRRKLLGRVVWSCWWDNRWGAMSEKQALAIEWRHIASSEQCLPWRGIAGPEF